MKQSPKALTRRFGDHMLPAHAHRLRRLPLRLQCWHWSGIGMPAPASQRTCFCPEACQDSPLTKSG